MAKLNKGYQGNHNLVRAGIKRNFPKHELDEFIKCAQSHDYFIENYVKIISLDSETGLINFKLYKYQKEVIDLAEKNRFSLLKWPRQAGKCGFFTTFIKIRSKTTKKIKKISLGNFYLLIKKNIKTEFTKYEKNEKKFIETLYNVDWEIETDKGWSSISQIHKTVEFEVWKLITESGKEILCADDHIIFDDDMQEIFVKDCIPNQTKIQTRDGIELVRSVENLGFSDNMYDLSIDDENHRYYTNDILSHNTTTIASYLLWKSLFNKFYNVAILANKHDQAREILSRIQTMYEYLPDFLKQGVIEWNKGSVEFENGSTILTSGTSSSAIRGRSINCLYLDEFAFVPENMQQEFYTSALPTVSSGKTTKIIISSTPNGLNLFYKLWADAEEKKNNFKPHSINWWDTPGRDEKWKIDIIKDIGEEQFTAEYGTEFLGSSNTLINADKLRLLRFIEPDKKFSTENTKVYKPPEKNHIYFMSVDAGTGSGGDYSAFTVIDSSVTPNEVVCVYRNKYISPFLLPNVIYQVATQYNNAYVLIETQIGAQVADLLYYDLEYENILSTVTGKIGQQLSSGFGGSGQKFGVHQSRQTKRIGCANLKTLIESDKLIVNDYDIVYELSRFISKRDSFAAEGEGHDDLVLTLVLFSWMSTQVYYKDLTDSNVRKDIADLNFSRIEDEVPFFGVIDNGTENSFTKEEILEKYDYKNLKDFDSPDNDGDWAWLFSK